MSNLLDTEFYNGLEGDVEAQDAFHLLRRKMFEAKAENARLKAKAEDARAEKAKDEEKVLKAKADELTVLRDEYFKKYGSEFMTENLNYAGRARLAAKAVNLRFSTYLETEVDENGLLISTKIKCIAQIPQKKNKK